MTIIDLSEGHRGLFAACLEDWSDDVREAGDRRARWVERSLAKGLRAKLAVDDRGAVGGMIQYLPIEQSTVQGTGLYFIPCIWVHGQELSPTRWPKTSCGRWQKACSATW